MIRLMHSLHLDVCLLPSEVLWGICRQGIKPSDCRGSEGPMLKVLQEAAEGGEEVFYEQFYAHVRKHFQGTPQTDSMLLELLKEIAEENGYLTTPIRTVLLIGNG